MSHHSFTDPKWEEKFSQAGYTNFDSWWNAEKNLVEEGNFRGADSEKSWSHVSKINLPDGKIIYLKRQQNHYPNNSLLKLRRIQTFEVEWENYKKLQAAGVPTIKYVHFEKRRLGSHRQSILVSEELTGMTPILDLIHSYQRNGWPPRKERLAILGAILKVVKRMHTACLIHNALYSRHIYLNIPLVDDKAVMPKEIHACLIDLERTKQLKKNSPKFISNDLEKMYRRINQWPASDCLWFLKQYLGIDKLTPEAKKIARKIAASRK